MINDTTAARMSTGTSTVSSISRPRPRLAVFKFASCDGCQLSLLDCEDELLAVASAVEIAYFPEASSRLEPGPYDVALVEGSITTPHDARRIKEVRQIARLVVTIGACATSGGIQSVAEELGQSRRLSAMRLRPSGVHFHPGHIHADCGSHQSRL